MFKSKAYFIFVILNDVERSLMYALTSSFVGLSTYIFLRKGFEVYFFRNIVHQLIFIFYFFHIILPFGYKQDLNYFANNELCLKNIAVSGKMVQSDHV